MRKQWMLASTILLSSCAMVHTTALGPTLILKPQIQTGAYSTKTVVNSYTQASINHLILKLYTYDGTEHDQGIQKSILNAQLGNSITFSNLKANTTYRIKAYAYLTADESQLISTNDASSSTDVPLTNDDRPTLASLKVQLINQDFNGQATASGVVVTNGGYSNPGSEQMVFLLSGIISTAAGNGSAAYAGEGGPATAACLNTPYAIACDSTGNLCIADNANNRVRMVNKVTGIISTVAGNGTGNYSGDGGQATTASLNLPRAMAFDSTGNLYIVDKGNQRIRKVDKATGIISTVAGNGVQTYAGDGGQATAASFNNPIGIAFDSNWNLYITDFGNNCIRKIDKTTWIISTVAGNGVQAFAGDGGQATAASLNNPRGIAFDANDNLYIADVANNRVRKVDKATGIISTIAGNGAQTYAGDGGQATAASLSGPASLAFDILGNLYIADGNNQRIRKIDKTTGLISTIAGNGVQTYAGDGGQATAASLNNPSGLAFDLTGNLYIADYANERIRIIR